MTRFRIAGRAGVTFIPIALLLAACAGGTASGAPTGTGGTSAATAATSPSAGAVETSAPSDGAFPSFAIPSFDVGAITRGLENVDSYQIAITVNGVEQYKGTVVTKPELSRDITISGGTHIVVIGDEAWVAQGSEPLKAVPAQIASSMFAAFDPTLMVGMFAGPEWAANSLDKGVEQKNGVSAHHYLIDATTVTGGLTAMPAGASINLWIADEGYLVALESTGMGNGDLSIQVTDVDDPSNVVERPS